MPVASASTTAATGQAPRGCWYYTQREQLVGGQRPETYCTLFEYQSTDAGNSVDSFAALTDRNQKLVGFFLHTGLPDLRYYIRGGERRALICCSSRLTGRARKSLSQSILFGENKWPSTTAVIPANGRTWTDNRPSLYILHETSGGASC